MNSESWGSFSNIGYNSIAQQVDSYVWATQTHLPVFAAGNSGDPNDFGVLLLLGPEASAKNALTVGATMNELEALVLLFPSFAATYGLTLSSNTSQWSSRALAGFSSNGPTLDRRIKPDIVVPGQLNVIAWEGAPRTNTPTPECTFTSCMAGSTGTSFSAPLAAGTVVLLRQWLQQGGYRNGNTFSLPSAALLKNLMIATAQPLNGINYYEESSPFFVDKSEIDSRPELSPYGSLWAWGHGVPQLRPLTSASPGTQNVLLLDSFSSSAMAAQSTPLTTFDSIDQEQNFCVTLTLPPLSQTTFTASLVWSDFPGSLPTSGPDARVTRLVNDLDIFSMSDSCSAGLPNELANPDHLNNVERVRFAQDNAIVVSADAYHLVVVRSSRIVVSGQHFSVVLLDSDSGALLSVQPIVLNRPGAGTDLSPLHPCSVIYANCRAQIDALRDLAVSLPTPSLGPSSSGSAPLRHLGRGTWLVVVAVLVALHALGTIN